MSEALELIFFEPGMYIYLPVLVFGFCGWLYMFKVSYSTFPKIKSEDRNLYAKILGGKKESWLEKGCYSPADIGIQWRLYRSIYRRDANRLLTQKTQTAYIVASRVFILAAIVFVGLFCLFWVAIAGRL